VKSDDPANNLSAHEITVRKKWLELEVVDEDIIKEEIDGIVSHRVDELMDQMYEHFMKFEDTRSFFPNEQILNRAKSAQAVYFKELTKGQYDEKYVENRLHVGSVHHRIELDPKWYIGAYNHALSFLFPIIIHKLSTDPVKLNKALIALLKVIFFDMGLAIERYINAKEQAIRKHRDALRELETEKRVTKSILASAPIGIVSLSEALECLECNDEFVQILDPEARVQVIGRMLSDVAPQLNSHMFDEVFKSGQPYRQMAENLRMSRSGLETYWDLAVWPVKDDAGKVTGLVAMFANATDRVLLQQQREDFVATLTHDLKTPVLATNRAVQFLLDGDFGPILPEQREILETLLQSNSALYRLVQTLLEVYRFDSGVKELNMRDCSLPNIITQLVTEIMPLCQEKGVELTATFPGDTRDVSCDEAEIRRVIQNLIDNSLKFTPAGGTITVSLEQSPEWVMIKVADTGKGILEENKPKLFQRFWQAGSPGRYYASTGLGLYLCRRIVEAHNGRIWCESTFGKGSAFYFTL
jgi:signal transduction histidine kinase